MPNPATPTPQSRNEEMLEKAYEMACLSGLLFKHAGHPEIADRLRTAVAGWGRQSEKKD